MKFQHALAAAALVLATSAPALAAPPSTIPVQGVVADDGGPLNGSYQAVFTLYSDAEGATIVWSESQTVAFEVGFFASQLGLSEALDLSLFADVAQVYLGVAIDGDDEMDLIPLATAPYAAYAAYADTAETASFADTAETATTADTAGDATTLGGLAADAFEPAGADVAWDRLTAVPDDLADGDDDTTYTAGAGLTVDAGMFSLSMSCSEGQVLKRSGAGWDCADDAMGEVTDQAISTVVLGGTTLTIREGAREFPVDLSGLVLDNDPTNELLTGASLDGTALRLSDAGGTRTVDLSSLASAGDDDADPSNEVNLTFALLGTQLNIVDAGGTLTAELASLIDDADADPSNEIQALATTAVPGEISISDGNTVRPFAEPMAFNVDVGPTWTTLWARLLDGSIGPSVDDSTVPYSLPFPVTLDGVEYLEASISSNGWMAFESTTLSRLSNACLPSSTTTAPLIAPYWDDMYGEVRWGVTGSSPNRTFTVAWNIRRFGGADFLQTAVAIQETSNAISVIYYGLTSELTGTAATIGYQGAGGNDATAFNVGCNADVLDPTRNSQSWSVAPIR